MSTPSEPANKSNDLNLMVDDLLQQMVRFTGNSNPVTSPISSHLISPHLISSHLISSYCQQTRFDSVGRTIETRLQDMDHRMTELETSIQELINQAGLNGTTPKSNNNNNNTNNASAKGKAEI
jgi:hypothetical protein